MKNSNFKSWVRQLYLDNCEERLVYNMAKHELHEYVARFRWWLRREYRHQQGNNK